MSCFHKRDLQNSFYSRTNQNLKKSLSFALALLVIVGLWACQYSYKPNSNSDNGSFSVIDSASPKGRSVSIPLAVYPLKNFGSPNSAIWVGPTLTELLISDLSHWSHLTIVSRGNMSSVLREQWIQKLHSDSEELVRVGRLQGARLLVQGGFLEANGQVIVDLQIIDVETGVIWDTVRAEGRLVDLHLLEQSLVRLLLERLPQETSLLDGSQGGEKIRMDNKNRSGNSLTEPNAQQPSRELPSQLVFQEDMSFVEGSQSQLHIKIARAAKKVFKEGFTVELGRPFHGVKAIQEQGVDNVPFLFIPLGVYAEKNRIRAVMNPEISHDLSLRVLDERSSSQRSLDRDFPELQTVIQQLAIPRRLYVRARSDQDEIVAVFSRWEWRTDRVMSFTDGLHMKMPFWPSPFMTGTAEFPINWLERGEMALTFDAVFLEVNQEEADVSVEWIEFQHPGEVPGEKGKIRQILTGHLQKWIQEHWAPSLGESLPLKGYLPHNKQRAHLRLHVENGIVTQIVHHYSVSDPVFVGGLEELANQLLHACPWCEANQNLPDELQSADFRVQCTLTKPIHHVGLGSRLP